MIELYKWKIKIAESDDLSKLLDIVKDIEDNWLTTLKSIMKHIVT
jgi:hypothetical protein